MNEDVFLCRPSGGKWSECEHGDDCVSPDASVFIPSHKVPAPFLAEVERRAGASLKEMLDWIQGADAQNSYDTERVMYWLRRILEEQS